MSSSSSSAPALIEFLGTFPTLSENPPESLEEMSDGVAIFEALSEIAPDYFDPTTIARHLGDNWALKASNLRKLLRNLERYYREDLRKGSAELFEAIQINGIARNSNGRPDESSIVALLQLLAAASVTCPNKATYITRIMNMSAENQVTMKSILESSLSKLTDYEQDEDDDEEEDEEEDENEMVFHQDHEQELLTTPATTTTANSSNQEELEKALADARRELATFKSQAALQQEDSETAQAKLRALVEDLQDRLVKRQDELIATEEELQTATAELDDAKAKLHELEQSNTTLADELDVANAKVEQLRKAEATVLSYRKKLEGVGVMNQQMTELEDQAASYLRQIMDLENDVKRLPGLQKNVEELQSKLGKVEQEHEESVAAAKAATAEMADLKSRLASAENAKKMYEEELRELKAQHVDGDDDDDDDEDVVGMKGLSLTSADSVSVAREKALRLEVENKKLREDLEKLKNQQAAVSVVAAASDGDAGALQSELARLKEELADKEAEKAKIGSDKDKLEAYTKRTLAKFQEKYLVALQECKAKLKEKQDKIEALENRSSSEKTAQKREERLLSSTIYELGLAIMQNRLKERMVASAVFITDLTGKAIISRNYRGDVPLTKAVDRFAQYLAETEDETKKPVFHIDTSGDVSEEVGDTGPGGETFVYVNHNNLYLCAVTRRNSNVALILTFLYRLAQVFKDYFGTLEEESIRDNFVVIYELLDETMDHGLPQSLDSTILRSFITQDANRMAEDSKSKPPVALTNAVSWRAEGIKHKKNEIFLDVVEKLNLLVAANGTVLHSEINGAVKMKSFLSGMPELKLGLNDKLMFEATGRANQARTGKAVELEDIKFHQCVRLARFENDRTISFIPPDGEFDLMTYRLNTHVKPLVWVEAVVEPHKGSRIEYMIKTRSQFKSRSVANNVEIIIPVPPDVDSPSFKSSVGTVTYLPDKDAVVWTIKQFHGGREYLMRAHFGLPSISASDVDHDKKKGENSWKAPIRVKFEIPYFTVSGIQVRYLKIIERSGYQALPWVRYITANGDYQLRMA